MSTTLRSPAIRTDGQKRAFLEVNDLRVHFPTADGLVKSVDGLSFDLERGEILGIVGESGSGKSVTSLAILGLHKGSNAKVTGEIWLDGREIVGATEDEVRDLRGSEMGMIFQDPLSSLHPFYSVGAQISEAYLVHTRVSKKDAKAEAIRMLEKVGIPNAPNRYNDYPHQFSGGMRQRAMIAMALICKPRLLIADEPTTALDVTVQAQILELIKDLHDELNSAVILITHDLGVVAETCDKVLVMYGGQCVEKGRVDEPFMSRRCRTPGACSARCREWTATARRVSPLFPGHHRRSSMFRPDACSTRAVRSPTGSTVTSAVPSIRISSWE